MKTSENYKVSGEVVDRSRNEVCVKIVNVLDKILVIICKKE